MSGNCTDGSLSDVKPELLELSKDPVAWREQRRRALREKVFGKSEVRTDPVTSANPSTAGDAARAPCAAGESGRSAKENEAYVLQQIMSRKRRREEVAKAEETPAVCETSGGGLSMKEKLLQRLKKTE